MLVGLLALLCALPAIAADTLPTGAELRVRYLQFLGGEQSLREMQVVERAGRMRFFGRDGEEDGTYRTCVQYTDRVAVALDLPNSPLFERWTAVGGAQVCTKDFAQCNPADAGKEEELRGTALNANREVLYYNTDWSNASVMRDTPGVARITLDDAYYRVDIATGQLVETGYPRSGRSRRYGDWHRVGSVTFPFQFVDSVDGKVRYSIQLSAVIQSPRLTQWCTRALE